MDIVYHTYNNYGGRIVKKSLSRVRDVFFHVHSFSLRCPWILMLRIRFFNEMIFLHNIQLQNANIH